MSDQAAMKTATLVFAHYLEIDIDNEPELIYIAENALLKPPKGWEVGIGEEADNEGIPYFYNESTGESRWQHPDEEYLIEEVKEAKRKLRKERKAEKKERSKSRSRSRSRDRGGVDDVHDERTASRSHSKSQSRHSRRDEDYDVDDDEPESHPVKSSSSTEWSTATRKNESVPVSASATTRVVTVKAKDVQSSSSASSSSGYGNASTATAGIALIGGAGKDKDKDMTARSESSVASSRSNSNATTGTRNTSMQDHTLLRQQPQTSTTAKPAAHSSIPPPSQLSVQVQSQPKISLVDALDDLEIETLEDLATDSRAKKTTATVTAAAQIMSNQQYQLQQLPTRNAAPTNPTQALLTQPAGATSTSAAVKAFQQQQAAEIASLITQLDEAKTRLAEAEKTLQEERVAYRSAEEQATAEKDKYQVAEIVLKKAQEDLETNARQAASEVERLKADVASRAKVEAELKAQLGADREGYNKGTVELKEQLKIVEHERDQLKNQLDKERIEVHKQREAIAEMKAQLSQRDEQLRSVQTDLATAVASLEQSNQTKQALRVETEAAQSIAVIANKEREVTQTALTQATAKLQVMDGDMDRLKSELSAMRKDHESLVNEHGRVREATSPEAIFASDASLRRSKAMAESEVGRLMSRVAELELVNRAVREELDRALDKESQAVREVQRALDRAEHDVKRHMQCITEQRDRSELDNRRVAALERELTELQDAGYSRDRQLRDERHRAEQAETARARAEDARKGLEEEVAELRRQLSEEKERFHQAIWEHKREVLSIRRAVEDETLPLLVKQATEKMDAEVKERVRAELQSALQGCLTEMEGLRAKVVEGDKAREIAQQVHGAKIAEMTAQLTDAQAQLQELRDEKEKMAPEREQLHSDTRTSSKYRTPIPTRGSDGGLMLTDHAMSIINGQLQTLGHQHAYSLGTITPASAVRSSGHSSSAGHTPNPYQRRLGRSYGQTSTQDAQVQQMKWRLNHQEQRIRETLLAFDAVGNSTPLTPVPVFSNPSLPQSQPLYYSANQPMYSQPQVPVYVRMDSPYPAIPSNRNISNTGGGYNIYSLRQPTMTDQPAIQMVHVRDTGTGMDTDRRNRDGQDQHNRSPNEETKQPPGTKEMGGGENSPSQNQYDQQYERQNTDRLDREFEGGGMVIGIGPDDTIRSIPEGFSRIDSWQGQGPLSVRKALGIREDDGVMLSQDFASMYDGGFHTGYWRTKYQR